MFFDLRQNGDVVIGTFAGTNTQITGKISGDHLHLTAFTQSRQTEFDATRNGERFVVQITAAGRPPFTGTLERTSSEVAFPAKLPLPELQEAPDNGLVRTPPMGWNSWNRFAELIDDATVRTMADAMVASGMSRVGYQYVVVDEGWTSSRDGNGNLTGNGRFPDMKALADYIHSKGLKAGIYTSPGPQACGGYEGSYGHEEQDAKTFAHWGYDYLKYDWCTTARIYGSTRQESQAITQKMGEALLHSGRPIVYSIHSMGEVWVWGPAAGANLWRTTNDISDNWESMDRIGFAEVDIADRASAGHWNDPDMLEVGNGGMTAEEYRTHMSLWALLAAPLMAGNDLRTMTEETKSILMNAEVIAIDQDLAAKPVKRLSRQDKTEILVRPLRDTQTERFGVEHSVAVGLFNRADHPAEVKLWWEDLHLGGVLGAKKLQARDLWKHEDVPVKDDFYEAIVPTHGVVLLKVSAVPTR